MTRFRITTTALLGCMLISGAVAADGELSLPSTQQLDALAPAVRTTLQSAIESYRSLPTSASSADRAAALESLGRSMHAHDQVVTAAAAYDQAIALQPERFAPHYLRAMLALGVGDVDQALAGLERAIALRPDYQAAYLRRGELLLGRGRFGSAAKDFDQVLRREPDSAAARAGLGRVALQQDQAEDALTHLQAALAKQPDANRLRVALGLAYRKLGRVDEARQALALRGERAVQFSDPEFEAVAALRKNPATLYEQARALAAADRLSEAVAMLAQVVEMAPDEPIYQAEYGLLLFRSGDLTGAEIALAAAWAQETDVASTPALRARIAQQLGDNAKAARHYSELLALQPDADDARVELARLNMSSGNYAAAAEQFEALTKRADGAERNYAQYWSGLARAMHGDCPTALAHMQAVFDASAGRDGWAMLGLSRLRALCASDSAQRAESKIWAEQLYRQHPGLETAVSLAMVAASEGDFDRAKALQTEAIASARRDGESLDLIEDLQHDLRGYENRKLPERAYSAHSSLLREN